MSSITKHRRKTNTCVTHHGLIKFIVHDSLLTANSSCDIFVGQTSQEELPTTEATEHSQDLQTEALAMDIVDPSKQGQDDKIIGFQLKQKPHDFINQRDFEQKNLWNAPKIQQTHFSLDLFTEQMPIQIDYEEEEIPCDFGSYEVGERSKIVEFERSTISISPQKIKKPLLTIQQPCFVFHTSSNHIRK